MQSKSLLSRIFAMVMCLALVLSFVPATIFGANAAAPASTATDATEAASDLLSGNLAYNKAQWDNYEGTGTGLTIEKSSEEVYGDQSTKAWKISASADANLNNATAQIHLTKNIDVSRHKLVMDVKYVTTGEEESASFTARMHTASWGDVSGPQAVTAIKDQWTTVSVIPSEFIWTKVSDLESCKLISFVFNFESTAGAERTIYIDNVRTVKIEEAVEDWIKLPVDVGMSNNLSYGVVDSLGVSDQAMKVVTPAGAGSLCFNTGHGVTLGQLAAYPDMTSGELSAWFYFGDADPAASAQITYADWGMSNVVDFTFEEKGNGWYIGSIDCASFEKKGGSDASTVNQTIRLDIENLPKKTTVYIDRLILDKGAIDGLSVAYPYNTDTYQLNEAPVSRFDALTFNSARNEVESAQMILTPSFEVTSFELLMTDLVNANGNVISADKFEVLIQNYAEVTNSLNGGGLHTNPETGESYWNAEQHGTPGENGIFPNGLIPQNKYIFKEENVIASGNNQGIWVNLNVEDAAPGEYVGNATLFVNGDSMQIPVVVNVYDVAIPDEVHVKSSFQIWWDLLAAGEGLADCNPTLARAYEDYLISKRIMPYDYWGISKYDDQLIPHIVVQAKNPSVSSYCLYNPAVNGANDVEGMRALLSALIAENIQLADAGDDVDLFQKAYFYIGNLIDEPRNDADYALVNSVTADIDALKAELAPQLDAYPELKASFMKIGHVVTGPDPLDKTFAFINAAQDYGTTAMTGDSYIYCPQYQWLHTEEQRARYADQEELWWYGCTHPVNPYPSFSFNSELMTARALGFMMYDYDVNGILYWCVNSWGSYGENGIELKDNWNTYSNGTPGEGILVLPGADYGITGPIGTIRMETIREALEDYEYLWMLGNEFGVSDISAYVDGLYEGAVPATDSAAYHAKRIALLEELEELNIAANGATVIEPDLEELPQDERPESEIVKYPVDIELIANGGAFTLQSDVTNGSEQAFVYNATSVPSHGYVYPSFTLNDTYDIDNHMLIADVKIVGDSDGSNLNLSKIDDKWPEIKAGTIQPNVWQTVTFNLATNASGKTTMTSMNFGIQLPGSSTDCVVYIDNIYLVPLETAEQDWIHMNQDTGSFYKNVTNNLSTQVKAKNSSVSMKVVAPADAKGKITFNTNAYFGTGNEPNMTEGTLGAWFYFGDLEPSALVQLTSSTWKGSISTPFSFVYGGDGWYYGTVDTSTISYYDENGDGAPDADNSAIIRVSLYTPIGSTVLIDGLTFPNVEDVTPVEPEYKEDIAADWSNLPVSSNATTSIDKDFFYAEESSQSLKVVSEGEEAYLTIDVSSITPNMTEGTLGAWFYFGDAEPSATLDVVDDEGYESAMHIDGPISFTFGEGVDGWYYGTVDAANILFDEVDVDSGASSDAIVTLNITLPAGTTYVDLLTFDNGQEEPPVTEPPVTEPPATEPDPSEPESADPGDLLAEATKADDIGIFVGGNFSWDSNSTVVNGAESTKSWMFATNAEQGGWPTALLNLGQSYDLTGKYLEMDVKTEGGRGYIAISNVYNSGWGGLLAAEQFNISKTFSGPYWNTVSFDLSTVLGEGKDLTDVKFIRFGFDFDTKKGVEQKYYIDNVRIVDEPTVDQNDILANGQFTWSPQTWNDGNGLVWDSNYFETYGEVSTKSWMFGASSDITAEAGYQMFIADPGYDMDGYYFVFDAKVIGAESQQISVRPHGGDSGWTDLTGPAFANLTNEWQTFMLDFSKNPWDGYNQYGLTNICRLNWTFYFDQTSGDRQVVIDNARLVKMESVEEDWINMNKDTGDSKATFSIVNEMLKAPGSSFSMKVDTSTGVDVTLNPQAYFGEGNYPNMTDGILSGYFYFGDQEPSANFRLTDKGWHGGVSLYFKFKDLGDGWYWGAADLAEYYFYADQIAAGASAEEIIRVKLQFPANYLVYVDGLTFNNKATAESEAATDLLYKTGNISYNNAQWDNLQGSGTGLTVNREYQVVNGEHSKYGWQFHAEDYASSSPVAQYALSQSYDITGKYLMVDFKFDAPEGSNIDIKARIQDTDWSDILSSDKIVNCAAGDWKTLIYDFSDLVKDGKDLTDVKLISFTFNFVSNTGAERTLYMDNLRWVDKETVEEDWINMSRDAGSFYYNGNVYVTNEKVKAEGSTLALKYIAPAEAGGKFTLNPAASLGAAPDLSNGVLGAWFYFGNQEPVASVQFTAPWRGSIPAAFTFGEGEDGWYYGTVDTSAIEFYEEGGDMTQVNRIMFFIGAGKTVYIDGITYTANETECKHENTTTTTVESTCTVAGSVTVTCDDCGEVVSTEELPLADHAYESVVTPPTTTSQGYTTHTCSVCGDSYQDNIKNMLPSGDATLKFLSAYLRLESDMTVTFLVKSEIFAEGKYTNPRVEYSIPDVLNNSVRNQVLTEYTTNADGRMLFPFTGISPRMMKATITATLYGTYEGVEYSFTMTYSLADYCYNQLNKTSNIQNKPLFLTLLADLLNFGTAHQKYAGHDVENLINADMTEAHKSYASKYELQLNNHLDLEAEVIESPTADFKGASLYMANAISVRLIVHVEDTTDVKLVISCDGKDYTIPYSEETWVPHNTLADSYVIDFDELMAKQMSSLIHATVYRNNEVISNTMQYSIESYISKNITKENMKELLTYMIYYGNSAAAYFS